MDPKVFGPDIGIPRIVGEAKLRQLRDVDMPYAWASGPGFFAEKKVGAERVVTEATEDNQPERPYFRTSGRVSVSAVPDDEPTDVPELPPYDAVGISYARPGVNADEEQTGPLKTRAASKLSRSFQTGRKSFGAYKPEGSPWYTAWENDSVWPVPIKFQIRWGAYFGNHRDVVTRELMQILDPDPAKNFGVPVLTAVAFRLPFDEDNPGMYRPWWTRVLFTQIVAIGFDSVGRTTPKTAFTVPIHSVFSVAHGPAQFPTSTTYASRTYTDWQQMLEGAPQVRLASTMVQTTVKVRPAAATNDTITTGAKAPGILVAHTARMAEFQLGYHTRPAVSYFVENKGDGTPFLQTRNLNIFDGLCPYAVDRTWIPCAMETGGDGRTYAFYAYSAPRSSAGLTVFNQVTTNSDRNAGIVLFWTRNRGTTWNRRICSEFRDMAFPSSYGWLPPGTPGTRAAWTEPSTSLDLWDRSISETFECRQFPVTAVTCPVEDGILITFTSLKPDPSTFASGFPRFMRHPSAPAWVGMGEFSFAIGITRTQIFKVSGNAITKLYDVDNSALAQPTSRMFLDMIYLGHNTLLAKVGPTVHGNPPARNYYQGNGIYGAVDEDRIVTSGLGDGNSYNNWVRPVNSGCEIWRSEDGGATWAVLGAAGFPGSDIMCPQIDAGYGPNPRVDRAVVYPATPRPTQMSGHFTCVVPRLPKKADPDEFEPATVTVPGYDPSEKAYFAYVSKDSGDTWERQGRIATTNRFHHMGSVGSNDIGRNFAKIEYIGTQRNPSPYNPALPTMLDPEPET